MSTAPPDFNTQVIDEFRINDGQVGGMFADMSLLLLHHVGAKSGAERIVPLAYLADGNRYVIFASKAGAPTNPAWYHNLKAHPETTIEIGTDTITVVADEATGDERDRLYQAQVQRSPQFGGYQEKTGGRIIPAIVLTPA
jgi:deazaflavin-dependent oxidoreductase (nitroreductase family)